MTLPSSTDNAPPPAGEPQEAADRQEVKGEIIEFVKMVVLFVVLFFALRTFVIEAYEVQGPSMEPTLHARERILVFKLPQSLGFDTINAGDIVVFDSTDDVSKRYVKRVIAEGPQRSRSKTVQAGRNGVSTPEESVPVLLDGRSIFVNSRRIQEDYISPDALSEEATREVRLPPGTCFVMGDNRRISKDSRIFGPVENERIVGKAVLRFWPLPKFGLVR